MVSLCTVLASDASVLLAVSTKMVYISCLCESVDISLARDSGQTVIPQSVVDGEPPQLCPSYLDNGQSI